MISTQVPTERRVERWSVADHEAVRETQAFLAKSLPELHVFFEQHPSKLTSCACEFCWGAAVIMLYARLVRAENEGTDEEIEAAMDALLRALVRINFCYSREHFLVLDVPEDGVKQCTNQIVAARRIMISTPSMRRQLEAVVVWSHLARFSQHGSVLDEKGLSEE